METERADRFMGGAGKGRVAPRAPVPRSEYCGKERAPNGTWRILCQTGAILRQRHILDTRRPPPPFRLRRAPFADSHAPGPGYIRLRIKGLRRGNEEGFL